MARGDIYYITTKKDDQARYFNEGMFYDQLDRYGLDYVEDRGKDQSVETLHYLSDMLRQMGAVITDGTDLTDRHFAFAFCFHDREKAQREYFEQKLEKLKKEVAGLELSKVIKSAPCLDMILNDTYTDMVVLSEEPSGSTMTYDDFIRRIKEGVTYYVFECTVLMH